MHATRRGFSLIELVIVVVILGIIGAIAIPRMSRGAEGAKDASLVADLAALRSAINLYQAEHEGLFPTEAAFVAQMTTYTDIFGTAQATKDSDHTFGPYLRAIPKLKVGTRRGESGVAAATGAGVAWIYDESTGEINANLSGETDANNVDYSTY